MARKSDLIKKNLQYCQPVTHSNILAIEAPIGGYGTYGIMDMDYTFYFVYTIYCSKNCRIEVIIHSGNWGSGAYGGNKELMSLFQMLAAYFAGVDALVYHSASSWISKSGGGSCTTASPLPS